MQRYFDVVQTTSGDAIPGALVYVYVGSTTVLATLFSDNGITAAPNPLTTNADGEYAFYAANGTYTIQIAATGYAGETKPGVVLFDPNDFSAFGSGLITQNYISPTIVYSDTASCASFVNGTFTNPNAANNDPVTWAQKFTKYDNGTDRFAHNVGGHLSETIIKGTGLPGEQDTDGTWIALLGNSVMLGENKGTSVSPDYDAYGNTIGVAGFARSNGYPGSGNIVAGLWGYADGPVLDATTQANLPATNWSLVGAEVNIQINHPDIGEQSNLIGKGSAIGYLAINYRTPETGIRDYQFGVALGGTPVDNNFLNPNVDDWNGFYTGFLIDKIKAKGIRFGQYFKNNSYGIWFPDSYAGSQEPAAAIYLGNSKINMAQYVGINFVNNDFWQNGGDLWFKTGGSNYKLVKMILGVASFGAHTATSDAPVTGYIEIKDEAGNTRKLAVIA
jgi:hypothetical protein